MSGRAQFTPTRLMVSARSIKRISRRLLETIAHLRNGRVQDARASLVNAVFQLDEEIERLS